jgi:hypothetical protein
MNNPFLGCLLLLCAFCLPAKAQTDVKKPRTEQPSAKFQSYFKVQNLVSEGYAQKKAEPLIKAGEILVENPTRSYEPKKDGGMTVDSSAAQSTVAKIAKQIVTFDVNQLIKDARVFANNDKQLLKSIAALEEKAKKPKSKGSVGGSVSRSYRVDGYSSRTLYGTFRGGELTELAILGDGDTDLDVYIYNADGYLVASDTDDSDKCYLTWRPQYTSSYRIVIKNRGRFYNNFVLMTN